MDKQGSLRIKYEEMDNGCWVTWSKADVPSEKFQIVSDKNVMECCLEDLQLVMKHHRTDLLHFLKVEIDVKLISVEDVVLVKEKFITSPAMTSFAIRSQQSMNRSQLDGVFGNPFCGRDVDGLRCLTLRKVCRSLREFLDETRIKPNCEVMLKINENGVYMEFRAPRIQKFVRFEKYDDGCLLIWSDRKMKLFKDESFVEKFLKDYRIFSSYMGSLNSFIFAAHNDTKIDNLLPENASFHAKEVTFDQCSLLQIFQFLPFFDSKSLKRIKVLDYPQHQDGKLSKLCELEQWKNCKYVEFAGEDFIPDIQDFVGFKDVKIQCLEISTQKILLLKEQFLKSSTLTRFEIQCTDDYFDVHQIREIFGPEDEWFFGNGKEVVHFVITELDLIVFNRLRLDEVPEGAVINIFCHTCHKISVYIIPIKQLHSSLSAMPSQTLLVDFPAVVKSKVLEKLGVCSILKLRKVCYNLRQFIDESPTKFNSCSIKVRTFGDCISIIMESPEKKDERVLEELTKIGCVHTVVFDECTVDQIAKFLPFFYSDDLNKIRIELPYEEDEHWKNVKYVKLKAWDFCVRIQDFLHFEEVDIDCKIMPIQNIVLLKENFLTSSTLTSFDMLIDDDFNEREQLHASFGMPSLAVDQRKEKWFFRIPNNREVLSVTFNKMDRFNFRRIDIQDVPKGDVIK
ncbi:hypothetical protein CRE_23338 [Caenorhabditis remanei]|uniref:F-box domain-containing protein n=1 Tax=Caenorhabditis remanei TaxID=31234 RepID=E3MGY3_CAERE|nr:hypothetical protein CRE_23338 [Caenorhabditis remanei]